MGNSGGETEPLELAKLIDSRIHDYAKDSLQRFALLFSMGSVAISLLFAAAVQLFLAYPVHRFCSGDYWLPYIFSCQPMRIILLVVLSIALFSFAVSLLHVILVFMRLHGFEAVRNKGVDKLESANKWGGLWHILRWRLHPYSIIGRIGVGEIWRYVWSEIERQRMEVQPGPEEKDGGPQNILRTREIASYEDQEKFIAAFKHILQCAELGKAVEHILRDAYRIVQRTLIVDRWFFTGAAGWLFSSFVLICIVNFFLFLGGIIMQGEKHVADPFKGKQTKMISVDEQLIDLEIYRPSGKMEARWSVVVIAPGGRGKNYVVDPNTGARFRGYNSLASELAKRGFVVLVFDGRGQGRSEGLRSHEAGLVDLRNILDFVERLPEADSTRIGVLGRCGGAAIALHLASKDPRIKSIMTWGMPPRFDELDRGKIERRLSQAGVQLKKGAPFLSGQDAALNVKQPLLVAGGSADTNWFNIDGRIDRQLSMIAAISEHGISTRVRFEVLRGASHEIDRSDEFFPQFVDLAAEWFENTLN